MSRNPQRKKIFISYRVQDTAADTGRLVDSLKQVFYEDQIFMDIEKLEPGVDFRMALSKSLETCDVLFAVIGPDWLGENKNGEPRIKDPDDWVRLELETALRRNIRLIPVLMRDATLPAIEEIPESLHPLLNRQTYEISNKRWKYDTDQLIHFLVQMGFTPKTANPVRSSQGTDISKWLIFGLFALVVIVLGVLLFDTSNNKDQPRNEVIKNTLSTDTNMQDETGAYTGQGNNNPVYEPDHPAEPVAVSANVEGAWYDAVNLYTMHITQSGNTLELKSINIAGVTTGEGFGTVDRQTIQFKIQIYNVGVVTGSAVVAEDNTVLNGKLIIANNGASYSEAFYWTKQ